VFSAAGARNRSIRLEPAALCGPQIRDDAGEGPREGPLTSGNALTSPSYSSEVGVMRRWWNSGL
jgi:hypothetical protein